MCLLCWRRTRNGKGPTIRTVRWRSPRAASSIDRVIADKMMICGAHFPFPGAGVFAKDGNAYTFTPVVQS